MGLSVVQMTTFGSLSKGELDTAKAVAFPIELNQDELAKWMRDRATYERKLKDLYSRYVQMANQGMSKGEIFQVMEEEVKGERLTESVNIDIKESSTEDLLNAL